MMNETCIFCKIAAGQIPSFTVYEDQMFRAILDLSPIEKGHILILPKTHSSDITELPDEYGEKLLPLAAKIGEAMMKLPGCGGFNLLQNNRAAAGQTVMHVHMHVIPRYGTNDSALTWEPGSSDQEELKAVAAAVKEALSGQFPD